MLGTLINAIVGIGALLGSRWGFPRLGGDSAASPGGGPGATRLRWMAAGWAVFIGGSGIAHTLPASVSGMARSLGLAAAGLLLGNLSGRILGLQRRLDAGGRSLSRHLPNQAGTPGGVRGVLSIGVLLALNPVLIPAAIEDGLEHRWMGLALKSALDAAALGAWTRSLSPRRWSLTLLPALGVVLLWQTCWTAAAMASARWLQGKGIADAVMMASSLLILCSAPAIAGIRRAALADLLPTLFWIPTLALWLPRR